MRLSEFAEDLVQRITELNRKDVDGASQVLTMAHMLRDQVGFRLKSPDVIIGCWEDIKAFGEKHSLFDKYKGDDELRKELLALLNYGPRSY